MIPALEVKVLDKNAEYHGITTIKLMENAGKGLADFIIKDLKPSGKNIIMFCGMGNNGGDGFVAARYLAHKYKVTLFLTGMKNGIKTKISKENFYRLKNLNLEQYEINSLNDIDSLVLKNDILIDSMLGIGLSGQLREPYVSIVNKFNNENEKTKICVDIPTGFGLKNAIKPDYTITFHDIKFGMNKSNCGIIKIVDIGIPKKAVDYIGPGELYTYYPKPKKESHKGENGRILVIGGGPYAGAPALSGLAALRTGSDLVFIATPKRTFLPISSFSPNLIVKDLNSDILTLEDISIIRDLISKSDSIIIGPGLGTDIETEKAILEIIEVVINKKKSLVVDADAIGPLGKNPNLIKKSKTVVTPHNEEFKKLTGIILSSYENERIKSVEEWAKKYSISIFLKGYVDIITNGSYTKLNKIGNEAMTVGGTGDVLAGIIGSFLSRRVDPFNAMRMAAFIIGSAGDECFKKKSYGLLPTDIIEEIPNVLIKFL